MTVVAITLVLVVGLAVSLVKWFFRPRTMPAAQIDLVFLDLNLPIRADIAIHTRKEKYEDVCYYDRLFWQIPAWVTTVGAVLLAGASRADAVAQVGNLLPVVAVVYGAFCVLSGYFLFRLIIHRVRSVSALQAISQHLGDHSVGVPMAVRCWFRSSAVLYMAFIDVLGVGSIFLGLWVLPR